MIKIKVLADGNLLPESLISYCGYEDHADRLLEMSSFEYLQLYITERCWLDICFYTEKLYPQYSRLIIPWLQNRISVIRLEDAHIAHAQKLPLRDRNSKEEVACAIVNKLGAIITQIPENFSGAKLPVLSVSDLSKRHELQKLLEKRQLPVILAGNLHSLDNSLKRLNETKFSVSPQNSTNLNQWLKGIFGSEWQGLGEFVNSQPGLVFRGSTLISRVKLLNLNHQIHKQVALLVEIVPTSIPVPGMEIWVSILSTNSQLTLPKGLEVLILDQTGIEAMQAKVGNKDEGIQLHFCGESKEEFKVKVKWQDTSIIERFVI